jgi:succinyl-CoA synthetase alpha subunit
LAVVLNQTAKVLAVAATGAYGRNQISFMQAAGTNIVGAVALGRKNEKIGQIPVFDTVQAAVEGTGADTAIIYAPPLGVRSAVVECADAGLGLAVAAAEFVPTHDTLYAAAYARERKMHLVGPNTAGMASPGQAMLGAITPSFTLPGKIGVISRSGTLLLAMARILTAIGAGQSTLVHVGGDVIAGTNPDEWLSLFDADDETAAILYLGEIGGTKEYALAERIATIRKPVGTFIVGRHAPAEKRMGHAGALIGSDRESAIAKQSALGEAGAIVCMSVGDVMAFGRSQAGN